MDKIFYRLNPWWENYYDFNYVKRDNYIKILEKNLKLKNIVLITGLRRIGKTTILKIAIKHFIEKFNINPKKIFYITLDYYGLENYSILQLVEEYRKIHKLSYTEKIFVFLDEIGFKRDFETQLKNLYDTENVKIFASSSSASVLKDKKALLTGREAIIEILPLTFYEFLNFKKVNITKSDSHLIESYFEDYLRIGGIPEYVLNEDLEYIKQLIDDIIYKDIIAHYNLRDKRSVREFFLLLMERAGKQFSLNKISKILDIGVDTVKRYFEYFRDTYLIYAIERCGKLNERLKSPKKIYAGDIGIKNAVTGFRDKGAIFENLVYLTIKKRNPCYVYKDKTEIDFLTEDKTLIEVKLNSELTEKQNKLFAKIKAKKKIIIDSYEKFLKFVYLN